VARTERVELPIEFLAPCRRHRTLLPEVPAGTIDLVRRHGVFLPVVVRRLEADRYEILANLVTWLAAQRVGIDRLPVVVLDGIDDAAADEMLAAEADGPLVRAERYWRALVACNGVGRRGAPEEVARQFKVDRTTVVHALRLRSLPEPIRQALTIGALRTGHAKVLAGCSDENRQFNLAIQAIQERWSVRRLEREAAGPSLPCDDIEPRRSADMVRLERIVSELIGCTVTVRDQDGVLEIDYGGRLDVLEGVLERLGYRG